MHVCFISNDNYVKYCYTAILSMIKNAHIDDELFIYILSDGISKENEKILLNLKTNKCAIEIIVSTLENMYDKSLTPTVEYMCKHKWLIPNILSYLDKVLYLDCDIIICDSIKELYNTDISEYPVAMIKDINSKLFAKNMNIKQGFYCNAGLILINIPLWHSQNVSNKLFSYTCSNDDQDIINAVLDKNIKLIDDIRYNLQCVSNHTGEYNKLELKNAQNNPCIVHYITEKPLSDSCHGNTPFLSEFWKYFTQTPYFKEVHLDKI